MTEYLKKRLSQRKIAGNLRCQQLRHKLIDFTSNDYLGLAYLPNESNAASGSTGSRLLTGNSSLAEDLEKNIASFHGYEDGILFTCGYMANVGLLSIIADSCDVIFFDAFIHASSRDGIRLSQGRAFAFRHNDLMHLQQKLKNCSAKGERFIVVESIYSQDGSIAPLHDICCLAKRYQSHVIVDEAHAVGVFGPHGRGLVAEHNLTSSLFAQIVTFGKALGSHGAIVLGSGLLKQALLNFATPYIYTTAVSLQALASIKKSYNLFPEMDDARNHLHTLIQTFCNARGKVSFTPIQAVRIKGNEAVQLASKQLQEAGFDVRALMSPTVPRGEESLRICLHSFNTINDLQDLLQHIACYD